MKVSVIIPVYNVERYLARCLDSVLAAVCEVEKAGGGGQRNGSVSVEIICVNDGSTDGSAKILEHHRSTFNLSWHAGALRRRQPSTFTVLTKPNGGLGSARNAGLDVATGDYILFVDSDDWIPAHAISTFVSVAEASKASLVVSTSFLKDSSLGLIPHSSSILPRWRLRQADWIAGRKVQYCAWNKFYRRELFAVRRYPATIYEDFPVTTDILCEVGSFAAVDVPLYVYCTNAGAASLVRSSFTEHKLDDSLFVVRETLKVSRRQTDRRMERFALRQAANGHSSTIGQVYKAHNPQLTTPFLKLHAELVRDYPEIVRKLSLKARYRLWRMS